MLRLTHKRDILQRQLAPGCSEKSSASAETAHTPAVAGAPWALFATLFALPAAPTGAGRSRPRFYLRHCRVTRIFVAHSATARCPPPGGGAPAESKTRSWFYLRHCRDTRECVSNDTTARALRRAGRALGLVETTAASHAILLPIAPQRNLAAGTARPAVGGARGIGRGPGP